jgi:hypothetical protein
MTTQTSTGSEQSQALENTIQWSKRFGLAGFLFFLGKGLFWLAVLAGAWRMQ